MRNVEIKAGSYEWFGVRAEVTWLAPEALWLARVSGKTPEGHVWSRDAKLEAGQTVEKLYLMAMSMAGDAEDSLDSGPARAREERL